MSHLSYEKVASAEKWHYVATRCTREAENKLSETQSQIDNPAETPLQQLQDRLWHYEASLNTARQKEAMAATTVWLHQEQLTPLYGPRNEVIQSRAELEEAHKTADARPHSSPLEVHHRGFTCEDKCSTCIRTGMPACRILPGVPQCAGCLDKGVECSLLSQPDEFAAFYNSIHLSYAEVLQAGAWKPIPVAPAAKPPKARTRPSRAKLRPTPNEQDEHHTRNNNGDTWNGHPGWTPEHAMSSTDALAPRRNPARDARTGKELFWNLKETDTVVFRQSDSRAPRTWRTNQSPATTFSLKKDPFQARAIVSIDRSPAATSTTSLLSSLSELSAAASAFMGNSAAMEVDRRRPHAPSPPHARTAVHMNRFSVPPSVVSEATSLGLELLVNVALQSNHGSVSDRFLPDYTEGAPLSHPHPPVSTPRSGTVPHDFYGSSVDTFNSPRYHSRTLDQDTTQRVLPQLETPSPRSGRAHQLGPAVAPPAHSQPKRRLWWQVNTSDENVSNLPPPVAPHGGSADRAAAQHSKSAWANRSKSSEPPQPTTLNKGKKRTHEVDSEPQYNHDDHMDAHHWVSDSPPARYEDHYVSFGSVGLPSPPTQMDPRLPFQVAPPVFRRETFQNNPPPTELYRADHFHSRHKDLEPRDAGRREIRYELHTGRSFNENLATNLPSHSQPARASSSRSVRPRATVPINSSHRRAAMQPLETIFRSVLQATLRIYRNDPTEVTALDKLNDAFLIALADGDMSGVQSAFFQLVAKALLKQNGRAKKNTERGMEAFKDMCEMIEKKSTE